MSQVGNALGARRGIHKLGIFFLSIRNLPSHMIRNRSMQVLLAVAKTEDLKRAYYPSGQTGYHKVREGVRFRHALA